STSPTVTLPAPSFFVPSRVRACTNRTPSPPPRSTYFSPCAGTPFTPPVPNVNPPASSATIGSNRPRIGNRTCFPIRCLYRSSSGCTATPVSPSIVSGRVVATTIDSCPPVPLSPCPPATTGYATYQRLPFTS